VYESSVKHTRRFIIDPAIQYIIFHGRLGGRYILGKTLIILRVNRDSKSYKIKIKVNIDFGILYRDNEA
jgi:hypothetical protein